MREIARDPADLVRELIGPTHHYPDGAVLYLGTMFAPTQDRGAKGLGFTHHAGDVVTIHAPELGALTNLMAHADKAPAWTYGVADLMRNLAKRGVL
jgi:fumarylacetoacetate (FAA) hydrolase family protein